MSRGVCWGIFREQTHSPGREYDDTEILRLTGKHLEAEGFEVVMKSPEDLGGMADARPRFVFLMCERVGVLEILRDWEGRGVPHVNRPVAVLNTYRDRMIAQFAEAAVAFVPSRLVSTDGAAVAERTWVKRADVHNTQEGDVVFAPDAPAVRAALGGLAARGIQRAVLQPHVDGDLIKFYGVGASAAAGGGPPWFRWFYHKGQTVAGHPLDPVHLARLARRAAGALGLEVYGGDAIATPDGRLMVLDLNAWPSFALYRDEAAAAIAGYLLLRFAGEQR
ncbi:MAG TPA: hypothetical protein VMT79_21625 [Candidatus Binatia bacterium]|nr:hypothetical protein [Candidatus Binatia bacterium]